MDRRSFLTGIGVAGMSAAFNSAKAQDPNTAKNSEENLVNVPRRKLGKTSLDVPCLALGGDTNFLDKQLLLQKAYEFGITLWDTAHIYSKGNAEAGMGRFISRNSHAREALAIVTKSSIWGGPFNAETLENRLQESLKRLNTNYVDIYYGVHGLENPDTLSDEVKNWAKSAKERGVIKFFGFSTHKNMAQCLKAASELDWIDVIMTTYNFRLIGEKEIEAGIDACHKAGIGLIAMKVQAKSSDKDGDRPGTHAISQIEKSGYTAGQAKLKVILDDERFAAACISVENVAMLIENVAVAMNKTKLTDTQKQLISNYAAATCDGYCAQCADICEGISGLPVADVMRYLMYYNSYGHKDRAREFFAQLDPQVREKLASADYQKAQALCPRGLPIAKMMAQAAVKLA